MPVNCQVNQSLEAWPGYFWSQCEKRQPITARDTHSSISPQFVEETLKEIDVRIKNEERLREVIPKAGLLNLHVT